MRPRFLSPIVCFGLAACLPVESSTDADVELDARVAVDAAIGLADAGIDAARDAGPPTARFVAPGHGDESATFFDLPWPSEARLTAEGTPELSGFPAPSRGIVRSYLDAIGRDQRGFSTLGAVYFRFTHPIDVATLPRDISSSLAEDASVFLVPLDDGSTRAERHPVVVRWEPRVTMFWPGLTLAVRPADGFPLRPRTLYAAVVTNRVRAESGATFRRDRDFEALLAGDPSVAELAVTYRPAIARLAELGVDVDSIVSLAVFRTQDPIGTLASAARWTRERMPAPRVMESAWSVRESTASYTLLFGRYAGAPIFQDGEPPYSTAGGRIVVDGEGTPELVSTFEARFALTIPTREMPEAGYPVVLYGHGTGGDFLSFVDDRTASLLAEQGYACMGIDAPLHGERLPGSDGILFFNVGNPYAVRWNPVQAALDHVAQARVARGLVVPRRLLEREGREIRLDPDRVYYVGHSQGALVGPLFVAVDPAPIAAVFSAGGSLIGHTLRDKTEPVDVPGLVRSLIGLRGASTSEAFEAEGFVVEHPLVTLMQGWIDVSDPGNYAPLTTVRPLPGFRARSVIATVGLRDTYVSPTGADALAVAFRIPVLAPVARQLDGLRLLGIKPELGAVSANLPEGTTGGYLQFAEQGHFGFFREMRARERIAAFFASLHEGPPGVIPGP